MLICFGMACYEARVGHDHAMVGMGASTALTLISSGFFLYRGRGRHPQILRKDAVAVVALGWLIAVAFGSLPFLLCRPSLSLPKAFFESMSGLTTTGSTVIADLTLYPNSLLLWRSLSQWIGGLGILALFVALLSSLGVAGRALVRTESSLNTRELSTPRMKVLTMRLWGAYVVLTIVCWAGLWLLGSQTLAAGMSSFEALLHALTAVSTGGFSPHNASIGHFDSLPVELYLCLFMIVCSFNMVLVVHFMTFTFDKQVGREEAKVFVWMIGCMILLVTLDLWLRDAGGGNPLRRAFFPVIAFFTSTGYSTQDYDQWPLFSQCLLMLAMICGGCAGSTSGGVKMNRVILAWRHVRQEVIRTFRPNQVFRMQLNQATVDEKAQVQVLSFLVITAGMIILSTGFVCLIEPSIPDFKTAFGAVLATFLNMGPGFGAVGPTDNFAHFNPATLTFLSLLMLLGRLEIFVVGALFVRSLWSRF